MGFSFRGTFDGEERDYEFALSGVGPTSAIATSTPVNTPPRSSAGEKVAQFSQARMAALVANQPDLGGVLTGGDGTANLSVSSMGGQADLSTAPDQPVWLRLKGSWSNVAGADADYILGAAGTHIRVGEGLALGVMAQVDHMESVDGLSLASGTGWLVGPYVVAKLPQHPLTVQGRLLFGRTANSFAPLGTYADQFEGTRLLGQLGLSGEVVKGAVTWRPSLQSAYVRETTDAYTDTMGNDIAAQESAIAQVAAGLDASFPVQVASGTLTATVGVANVWASTLQGADAAFEGHRGRISAGINRSFASGPTVSLTGSYDGIGTPDYESIGLDLLFQHKF